MDKLAEYRQYLFLSSELFCSMSSEGIIRDPIGPWEEKLGLILEETDGSDIFRLVHPDDIASLRTAFRDAQATNAPQGLGLRFKSVSGEAIWFEVKLATGYQKERFVMRALDISSRVKTDLENSSQTKSLLQEIGSIKQRLELAIRAVKFGVWDWDLKTGKLIWDSYMYEIFEISEFDFTNDYQAFEQLLFPEDRILLQENLDFTFKTKATEFKSEFKIRTRSGKVKVINAVGTCFYDRDGHIERIVGNNWDITSTRETERQLKEAHFEIEKFFSIALEPLCVASVDGYFKRVNAAFVEILGYSYEELTSQPFKNFIHPDDIEATDRETEKLSRGIPTLHFENRFRTKSGSYRNFNWAVAPDKETGLLYAAVRDMTDQIKTQRKALQSAQMATLGEMASGVAHEINNPLAIVQGKARQIDRAIQNDTIEVEKIRSDIHKLVATTDRIVKIVKGLRSFSRDSSKDPFELTSIRAIVEHILDLSRERFKNHGVDLRVIIETDMKLECRGSQLGQVLMNLVNNGHDAVADLDEKWVEIAVRKINDRVVITVTDSGRGIPVEVAEKMMQPFFTTKGAGKGTGLGLSISKGIIEDHQGVFKYDPYFPNTRFVLELPLQQKPMSRGPGRFDTSKEISPPL